MGALTDAGPGRLPGGALRQAAVAIGAAPADAGGMITQPPTTLPATPDAAPLAKALLVIFTVTLAIGIASTYLLAAVRPSLFV